MKQLYKVWDRHGSEYSAEEISAISASEAADTFARKFTEYTGVVFVRNVERQYLCKYRINVELRLDISIENIDE